MKFLSLVTLTALLSITACSHHQKHAKACCDHKAKVACTEENCKMKKDHKNHNCADGSCAKQKHDAKCEDGSCHKKS